jgi:hypothetical protein
LPDLPPWIAPLGSPWSCLLCALNFSSLDSYMPLLYCCNVGGCSHPRHGLQAAALRLARLLHGLAPGTPSSTSSRWLSQW